MNEITSTSAIAPDRHSGGPVDRIAAEIAALEGLELAALRDLWKKLYRNRRQGSSGASC